VRAKETAGKRRDRTRNFGLEDADIWKFFLETSLPLQADAEEVVRVLAATADWTQLDQLQGKINLRQSGIEGLLKILEVENAVERQGRSWRRTLTPWKFDSERVERVRQARLAEQRAMREYAELDSCRMGFLRRVLDDEGIIPCGRCDNCHGVAFEPQAPRDLVVEALSFVRRRPMELEPRKRWPGGAISGPIPQAERLELGRVLCSFGDPGWGSEVRAAKLDNAYFSDDLVGAAAGLIRSWAPQPAPAYIAYIPVREEDRDWVPDLAARLGVELRLPVREVVRRTRTTLPQKTMQNSIQQFRNIHGAFRTDGVPAGAPVLLVDDVSDSRWTMTYVGHLLRQAGAGPVHPFVLAGQKG
jgi:ATP-dependent DNA helicase RecQ